MGPESCVQSTFGIVENLHRCVDILSENLEIKDCPSEAKEDGIRGNVRLVGCSAGLDPGMQGEQGSELAGWFDAGLEDTPSQTFRNSPVGLHL